jgi:hypothetical protein
LSQRFFELSVVGKPVDHMLLIVDDPNMLVRVVRAHLDCVRSTSKFDPASRHRRCPSILMSSHRVNDEYRAAVSASSRRPDRDPSASPDHSGDLPEPGPKSFVATIRQRANCCPTAGTHVLKSN